MRVSSAAIGTFATFVASNLSQQAIATPTIEPTTSPPKGDNVVVPITEETSAPEPEAIPTPETVVVPQFSQNTPNTPNTPNTQSFQNPQNTNPQNTNPQNTNPQNTNPQNTEKAQSTTSKNSVVITSPENKPENEPENKPENNKTTKKQQTNNSPVVISPIVTSPPTPNSPLPTPSQDLVVTATDVKIVGASEELQKIIRETVKTQAGGDTSQEQLQQDRAAILQTGLFSNVSVNSLTTPTGLSIVFQVQPIIVRSLNLSGAKVLTYQEALKHFQPMVGKPVSPNELRQAVQKINKWYRDNGYNIARVLSIQPNPQGILSVNLAEGVVNNIKFRFLNAEGNAVDGKGKPIVGRTKTDFIRTQLKLKPGDVLKEDLVQRDLRALYATGLFETATIDLEGDANKTDVIYELKEIGARSLNFGGNYSGDQGLMGTLNYRDQNFGGVNDTVGVDLQLSTRDIGFNAKYSSPYRASNPDRVGYSVNAFRNRGLSETFSDAIKLANGDKVREAKYGASVSLQRPIDDWDAALGLNYTRTSIRDREGNLFSTDANGNPLSFSGSGFDDLITVSLNATKDRRNNPFNPTKGSIINLSTEQSVPLGLSNISMTRLRANYSQFTPVSLFNSKQPQVLAFNVQAGTVLGDLPPYESFNLGGSNSVRGYNSSAVASGRSFVAASAEYRFPVIQSLGGVVFADFASDLGSGDTVLGNPGGARNKPGTGFGYGLGVRFDSPLGVLRADYGISDQGESKVHFAIGQRF